MKKKILLDIDVVAVAEHFTKDNDHPIAKPFIERVKTGEFENYTTYALLDLVEKWKDERIAKKVLNIYRTYTYIIPASEIELKGRERKIVFEKLVEKIFKRDVKEEDGALAIIASLFRLTLVTLNRKHLRNKRSEINEILKREGLDEINIVLPNEV